VAVDTIDKDFKVKNGIQVSGDGIFGGTVSAATPTLSNHLVTKEYVDIIAANFSAVSVGGTEPENPSAGNLWLDTTFNRLKIYSLDDSWVAISYYSDPVKDHTHDTSINGTGLINASFVSSGSPFDELFMVLADGDSPSTTDWEFSYNGGIVS
jgi:hypothetical protein